MNKVIISGYIANDIEVKQTSDGTAVASVNIAVKRPRTKDKTDFFPCNFWRSNAEFLSKYFKKGSGIEVCGVLTTRSWEDQEGKKRYATEITVEEIDFGKKSKDDNANDNSTPNYNPYADVKKVEVEDDDDLPF